LLLTVQAQKRAKLVRLLQAAAYFSASVSQLLLTIQAERGRLLQEGSLVGSAKVQLKFYTVSISYLGLIPVYF
jgi:hypothetical protein